MMLTRLIIPLIFFLAAGSGCIPSSVIAEELQIADYLGLIRAQRSVHDKVAVRISVIPNPRVAFRDSESKPLLTQRTGFSGDIEAVKAQENVYIFSGVTAGFWRIRLRNNSVLLDAVEILDNLDPQKKSASSAPAVGGVAPNAINQSEPKS